jgi:hypothetical protein
MTKFSIQQMLKRIYAMSVKNQRAKAIRACFVVLSLLLIYSLTACAGGMPPQGQATQAAAEEARPGAVPTNSPPPTVAARVPERRLLSLEWPPRLRAGDADLVRLSLKVDEKGQITPTALFEDHVVIGEPVEIPDVFETHNVMAEARLDIAGLDVAPGDLVSQSLRPGEDLTFTWSIRGEEVGKLRGTVWLYLRFLPLDGGQESGLALSAQIIEIEVVNLFGIGGAAARIMGLVGVAFSGLLGADDILNGIRWLYRRKRGR